MTRDVENFSKGDVVQFKDDLDINWDVPIEYFDKEFVVDDPEGPLISLRDNGIGIGGWFKHRLEHVKHKQLSVESLQEYEGLFE